MDVGTGDSPKWVQFWADVWCCCGNDPKDPISLGSEGQQSVSGDQVWMPTVCAEKDELSEFCDFSGKERGLDFVSLCVHHFFIP